MAAPEPATGWTACSTGSTLSCIGDAGDLTYKRSRRGDAEVNRAVETVLRDSGKPHRVLEWEPWGGDERQFCSPGFDLPVGSLMRTPHGGFDGYHTSADALERIRPESLAGAVDTGLDAGRRARDQPPLPQPQPVRRAAAGTPRALPLRRRRGRRRPDDERALLWVLNQSDGSATLLDIAARSGLAYPVIRRAAERLEDAGLLA